MCRRGSGLLDGETTIPVMSVSREVYTLLAASEQAHCQSVPLLLSTSMSL